MIVEKIAGYFVKDFVLHLNSGSNEILLSFADQNITRIRCRADQENPGCILKEEPAAIPFTLQEQSDGVRISTSKAGVTVRFDPFCLVFYSDAGQKVLMTADRFLELSEHKKTIRFKLGRDEKIYGLGQNPLARLDQRDSERRMWQQWDCHRRGGNAGVPFMMSSGGYGILLNSPWASRFAVGTAKSAAPGSGDELAPAPWPWEEHCEENAPDETDILLDGGGIDLFVICRDSIERLLNGYADLTGKPPLIPKWALGLIQSKNRYRSWDELIHIGRKFREKGIPCDVLVIDWLWFKNFGDLEWAEPDWNEPEKHLKMLSDMGYKIMQAQHPFIDIRSLKYKEFREKGYLNRFPENNSPYYRRRPSFDHTSAEARAAWWKEIKRFHDQGIKCYWADMGEVQVDPPEAETSMGPREKAHNLYSLMWVKGLYEGSRSCSNERVFSLARTAYAGIEKYGAALWSGDIDSTWQIFKEQIVVGQGACLSGQQYWCTDVGGFFTGELRSGVAYGSHYQGRDGEGLTPELYIRWYEFGTFCPLFRTHGTRPGNEPWSFGEVAEDIVKKYIVLRYRMIPYIYSCAAEVSRSGRPIMRSMCVDYMDDKEAVAHEYQYMFGPSILVAPVAEKGCRTKKVYLPKGNWYDFRTEEKMRGGQEITVPAPLGTIPLFVKEGAIIPFGPVMNYIDEKPADSIEVHIFTGKDAAFRLYEDDGTTYNYENGKYSDTQITYSECEKRIRIHGAVGGFEGLPIRREYKIVLHGINRPLQVFRNGRFPVDFTYDGLHQILSVTLADVPVSEGAEIKLEDSAAVESPESRKRNVGFDADCDVEPDGRLTVHAELIHPEKDTEIAAKISLKLPDGWAIRYCSDTCEGMLRGEFSCIFTAIPLADALPVISRAELLADLTYPDGHHETLSRPVHWGSVYNARWLISGSFEFSENDTIDKVYPPEINPESDCYNVGGRVYRWNRLIYNEFNCFGYVDLRENGYNSIGDPFSGGSYSGIAYAKCHIWSPCNQNGYIRFSSEKGCKIWLNGGEVFKTENVVLEKTLENPVSLRKGWNDMLIKSTMFTGKPFSGREYGFNLGIMDNHGHPIENLLYKA